MTNRPPKPTSEQIAQSQSDNFMEAFDRVAELEAENERLREAVYEALGLAKGLWCSVDNHPASQYAKDVKYFQQVLKGGSND